MRISQHYHFNHFEHLFASFPLMLAIAIEICLTIVVQKCAGKRLTIRIASLVELTLVKQG